MDIEELSHLCAGDNIGSIVEIVEKLDEEIIAVSNLSPADGAFDAVIGCIEEIIMEEDFQQLEQGFMEKHYLEFDDTEENKLTYTPIFNQYIALLEKHLEQQLIERIPGFNMTDFTELLQQNVDELSGEVFDLLLTFSDFTAFKKMFLEYRAMKEGKTPSFGPVVTPLFY